MVSNIKMPNILADIIASNLNLSTADKQGILETLDVRERLTKVHLFLNKEVQVLELGNKIQSQVKEDMDRTQREYYLREQLKAIKKELGELDEHSAEIKELREKIKKAKMPPEAQRPRRRNWNVSPKFPASANTRWREPISIGCRIAMVGLDGDNLNIGMPKRHSTRTITTSKR